MKLIAEFEINWKAVKAINLFASKDADRYVLNGVQLDCKKEGEIILAGTDGRMLGAISLACDFREFVEPFSVILDSQLIAIAKMNAKLPAVLMRIEERESKTYAKVTDIASGMSFESRCIDGKYPNWISVVPTGELTPDVNVCINAGYLKTFADAIAMMEGKNWPGLTLFCDKEHHKGKATFVVKPAKTDLLGVIMPMMTGGSQFDVPTSLPEWWVKSRKAAEPKEEKETDTCPAKP